MIFISSEFRKLKNLERKMFSKFRRQRSDWNSFRHRLFSFGIVRKSGHSCDELGFKVSVSLGRTVPRKAARLVMLDTLG
jgi:hypothetical protein